MKLLSPTVLLASLLGAATRVAANTEKAIFLGPEAIPIPNQSPSLADLRLNVLTPSSAPTLRTELGRVFPSDDAPEGTATWFLLRDLDEGTRYEVRVCWSAMEPTDFSLDTFELKTVFDTPELIQSLAGYAASRQTAGDDGNDPRDPNSAKDESLLLLRVLASADYYTDDAGLMANPPPVLVDLILDPFIFNVLPRSLAPTVGYVIAVAGASWFVARAIASLLRGYAAGPARGAGPSKKNQ